MVSYSFNQIDRLELLVMVQVTEITRRGEEREARKLIAALQVLHGAANERPTQDTGVSLSSCYEI